MLFRQLIGCNIFFLCCLTATRDETQPEKQTSKAKRHAKNAGGVLWPLEDAAPNAVRMSATVRESAG